MNIKKLFGKNVRQARIEKGWSQEELADRAGLHRTYISGVERGKRNPTLTVIYKLSSALERDVSLLLKGASGK